MPSYKLTYFDGRGRAETLRLCLAVGGIEFEDCRIKDPEKEWGALKPSTPFGGLPILEVDGEMYFESKAMSRFIARKAGLAGKDDSEACMIDALVYYVTDCQDKYYEHIFSKEDKKEETKEALTKKMKEVGAYLEKFLKNNNGGDGYFVGNDLTWADLHFYQFSESILAHTPETYADVPKLKALFDRIAENPKVAAYLADRPKSQF